VQQPRKDGFDASRRGRDIVQTGERSNFGDESTNRRRIEDELVLLKLCKPIPKIV
jgi:hypothetical protein